MKPIFNHDRSKVCFKLTDGQRRTWANILYRAHHLHTRKRLSDTVFDRILARIGIKLLLESKTWSLNQ